MTVLLVTTACTTAVQTIFKRKTKMKNQRIFWFGIMIVCVLGFCALPAQAKYGGGNGTATEPYLIGTAEHMNTLGDESRDWDKHFKLIADIDFGGSTGAQFNFIGYSTKSFSGVFDGNGHSIHDFEPLDSCASYKSGLFGDISAQGKVQNLTLVNPRLQCLNNSSSFSGGLLVGELHGRVTNCHVIGGYIEKYYPPWPRNTTYGDIGGLVGSMDMDAVVSDCSVTDTYIRGDAAGGISGGTGMGTIQDCAVINIDIDGGWFIGGIISRNLGTVQRCSATGIIRAEWVAGGIAAATGVPSNTLFDPVIRECYASCIVLSDDQAGGLAGKAADKCLIIDCYATGSVEGHSNGGLVCCYGNFKGTAPQVVNCYAAAFVGGNKRGGLINHAHLDGGPVIVSNSFWDVEASGVMNSAGGTGITTAQMKTKDTFTAAGWDFTTPVWKMCDRPDYPRLWWEQCPPPLIIYVDADATGENNGSSWADAFNDLQDALAVAERSDEIRVAQGAYSPQGPLPNIRRASNPYPVDGSFGVSNNADLSWTAGADSISHDVYFGTTGPGMFQGNQTATTFDPGTMAYGTTYYWRIDEVRDDGKTTGTVWSFATMMSPPPLESGNEDESIEPAADRSATFQLKNCVVIKGGYAGFGEEDPNTRDIKVYETILTGDLLGNDEPNFVNYEENSYHVVTGSDCNESAVLDGFTITAGYANGSGQPDNSGGGMYNTYGSPTVINCTFTKNAAGYAGGMANRYYCSPTLINCTFIGNAVTSSGAGMFNWRHSDSALINCNFYGNFGRYGAAMRIYDSSPTLTNCTFSGNFARQQGGAIYVSYSSVELSNCSFSSNVTTLYYGGGIYDHEGSSSLFLTNCILFNNIDSGGMDESAQIHGGTPVVNYCCIQGWTGTWPGSGNTGSNPVFERNPDDGGDGWGVGDRDNFGALLSIGRNDDFGDLHLLVDSPCINAGDPNHPHDSNETDLDGRPRIIGGRIDMGAYEFNHIPVANAGPDQTVEAQAPWGAVVTLDGSGSSDADSTAGSIDDITDFNWYLLDPCDPNADVFLGSGRILDCNLQIGEHIVLLEVIDRAGAYDTNEVIIIVQDTTPPDINCLPNVTLGCPADTSVEANGSATASDTCGSVAIAHSDIWQPGCGNTGTLVRTWMATDEYGNSSSCVQVITAVDMTPPAITCPVDVTLECPADTSVEANGSATADDTCGTVTVTHSDLWQPGCGNTGILTRTWMATDECGNSSSCTQEITVVDTTPPEFNLSVAPTMLWPPDHKMYEIKPTWTVSDECDASPDVSLVGIVANEGDNNIGDGHTTNDIQINEDGSIYLRSERSGTGNDRIYTITYQAVDDCGNTNVRSATVSIPHDFKVLARIADRWLWAGPGKIPEDLNGDGVVNLTDFARFAENWIK